MSLLFKIFIALIISTSFAHAYIGPGLGVTLVGALWGPIAAFFTAIAILIYFPIRYLYRKRKHKKAQNIDND